MTSTKNEFVMNYGSDTERCRHMTSPRAARAYISAMTRSNMDTGNANNNGNARHAGYVRTQKFYSNAQYAAWLRRMSKNPGFEVIDVATETHPRLTVMTVTYRT